MVDLIQPTLIEKLWPTIWPMLRASVEEFGVETEKDVLDDLVSGDRALLMAGDACGVLRVISTGKKFLEINYIGGKNIKKWWPQMSEAMDLMAKHTGCKKIISYGRPAWKRIATDYEDTNNKMYIKEVA